MCVCVNLFHFLFFELLRSVVLCLLLILENYWIFFIQIFLLFSYLSLLLSYFNYTCIFDILPWLLDSLTPVYFDGFTTFFSPQFYWPIFKLTGSFLGHVISFDELTKGIFFITVTMFSIFITSRFPWSYLQSPLSLQGNHWSALSLYRLVFSGLFLLMGSCSMKSSASVSCHLA